MSEEIHRPWRATGLVLAGFAVVLLGLHFGLKLDLFWGLLIPAVAVFVAGFLVRHFALVEVRLLDGIAALSFAMTLVAISGSYTLYAMGIPLLVAAVAVTASRMVR